ncbi:glycosyltransferase family 1 protein [Acinetobacter faecalis]|uniref:Glycosyltransferase family 1 protein n=1 Tax=Acinetobacter faecalis TaxID=2665161 RepID=A0AB35UXA5_9GAMM|nr:glycosyltransferase family 1 protein [Acinetobacter faecalis]MDY6487078.1 glycosyltransferase family 1 protein [Acinetobacter faecalis]
MKVLLIGEYSGVHTNLAKGLKAKGHEVYIIGDTDGYKQIGAPDLFVFKSRLYSRFRPLNFLLNVYYVILEFLGVKGLLYSIKKIKEIREVRNYEVIQLINTRPFSSISSLGNLILLFFLFKNNNKIFLCALGDDYTWVNGCLKAKPKYSKFNRFKLSKMKYFLWSLVYVYGVGFKLLDRYVTHKAVKIIPGLYDYYFAYRNEKYNNKLSEIIPLPIEIPQQEVEPYRFKEYPIKIFHGWQAGREFDKGNDLFDAAIKKLIEVHPDKVKYEVVSGVPYAEYIKKFNDSAIYIDQCYSLDKGMNALLGMRVGKVVFSGFDVDVADYFSTQYNTCLIDAPPDKNSIYEILESLIVNPKNIESISINAIRFVRHYHNLDQVTQSYIETWSQG